jgi:hypothetical protein
MRRIVLSIALCAPGAIIWGQQPSMPTDTNASIARIVTYHGSLLRASFLFPRADPHYAVFPFFVRRTRYQAVVTEGRMRIPEGLPGISIQGFGPGTDWTLVKLERRDGLDVLRLPSRSPWGDGFFSDEPFSAQDIVPVTRSGAGDVYDLRPAAALSPGGYALCGRTASDQGGWARVCYDFEITAAGGS